MPLYENENDSDGIQNVLHELYGRYIPSMDVHGSDTIYGEQGLVADQLSVERGVNCLKHVKNGFTSAQRMDGLHLEVADFHAAMKFLQASYNVKLLFQTSMKFTFMPMKFTFNLCKGENCITKSLL